VGIKSGQELEVMSASDTIPDLEMLQYPVLVSAKLNGIHGIIKTGEMLTRERTPFNSIMIQRFRRIIDMALELGVVLDFEVWSPNLSFAQISSAISDPILCNELKLYIFDVVDIKEWCNLKSVEDEDAYRFFTSFNERYVRYSEICRFYDKKKELIVSVRQHLCLSADDVREMLDLVLKEKLEGLMLKSPTGFYLHGRCTEKQGIFWKLKG
jgi:hypothetical protein